MTSSKKLLKPPLERPANSDEDKAKSAGPNFTSSLPPPKPLTPLERISAIRQGIKNTYGAEIKQFVQSPPSTQKERADTKARLSEMLLQQLVKLDGVAIDPEDFASQEAKSERKATIKWVQGLMDEIDCVDTSIATEE